MVSCVKDEVSDILFNLYNVNANPDIIKATLEEKLAKEGRIGFNNKSVSDSEFFNYISKLSPFERINQHTVYTDILKQDLNSAIKESLIIAKSVMPEQEYFDPTIVLLVDSPGTDARVINNKEAGINLLILYYDIINLKLKGSTKEEWKAKGMKFAVEKIKSMAIHEANHLYLKQVNYKKSDNPIVENLFGEGLATFLETKHLHWHYEYLEEKEFWINNIKRSIDAKSLEDKLNVLNDMIKSPTFAKYQYRTVDKIKSIVKEKFDDKMYNNMLNEILVKSNGAAYHIGYYMWSTIAKKEGMQKVTELIKEGPEAFVKEFLKK